MISVSFSFDDSPVDTYTVVYPILKEYGFPFTINVITSKTESGLEDSMTALQLKDCQDHGAEIACHGHTHKNTEQDVIDCIDSIKRMGLFKGKIGFASPNSYITNNNGVEVKEMVADGRLAYIRTGISVRREGLIYSALSYLERKTHSKSLFWHLNKRNIIKDSSKLLMSVAITRYTTVNQIIYLLNKLNGGDSVILMFHHVVPDIGAYKNGTWYFEEKRFRDLCEKIKGKSGIEVKTTMDLVKKS